MPEPLLQMTDRGLYCRAGDFHIDPHRSVERAIVTHAHADHARPGSRNYLTADRGGPALRARLGRSAAIQLLRYGENLTLGSVRVSLHPSGHLLGAAQVRIELDGEVWVVSGDYKTHADPTCEPLETLRCHAFVTESTFGLPKFHWPASEEIFSQINEWWQANQRERKTSVLLAYPLGKAQRLLCGVNGAIGPIFVHPGMLRFNNAYKAVGVRLPPTQQPGPRSTSAGHGRGLVIAPPVAAGSAWLRKFGQVSVAMVSGWMQIRPPNATRGVHHGFVLSDHADWAGLLDTIRATGAERIWVMHGYIDEMSRRLRDHGWNARAVSPPRKAEAMQGSLVGAGAESIDAMQVQRQLFDEPYSS